MDENSESDTQVRCRVSQSTETDIQQTRQQIIEAIICGVEDYLWKKQVCPGAGVSGAVS
jgi:hypothetical protein